MSWGLLVAALAMGFFGSPHCLGMCGGIVSAFGLSMQSLSSAQKNTLMLTYHFGRLLSYAILGVIASLIGTALLAPLMVGNSLPRILLGTVLAIIGLSMLGLPLLNHLERLGMRLWQSMSSIRQKVFPINSIPKALAAGLLWGFLPCGLVYGALLMAVVGHDTLTGAVLMFVFGLGTIPMLVATQKTVGVLQKQIKTWRLRQLNGVILILSGLAVIFGPMFMHSHHGGHGQHQMQGMQMDTAMSTPMAHHNHHDMSMSASGTMPSHMQDSHAIPAATNPQQATSIHHDMTGMSPDESTKSHVSPTASTTSPSAMPMHQHNMDDMPGISKN